MPRSAIALRGKKKTDGKYTNRGYDLSQIGTTFKASCNQITVNSGGMD